MDTSTMSDEELYKLSQRFQQVLDARKAAREEVEADKHRYSLQTLQKALTEEVIDALAPDHRKSRYHRQDCSDEQQIGASRHREDPKEYRCQRCALQEFTHLEDYELADVYVSVDIEISGIVT